MNQDTQDSENNGTWELTQPLQNCRPIGLQFMKEIKQNSKGKVRGYKAQLSM